MLPLRIAFCCTTFYLWLKNWYKKLYICLWDNISILVEITGYEGQGETYHRWHMLNFEIPSTLLVVCCGYYISLLFLLLLSYYYFCVQMQMNNILLNLPAHQSRCIHGIILIKIIIQMPIFMVLSSWQRIAKVHPVHLINVELVPSSCRPESKPIDLDCESVCRQPESTPSLLFSSMRGRQQLSCPVLRPSSRPNARPQDNMHLT